LRQCCELIAFIDPPSFIRTLLCKMRYTFARKRLNIEALIHIRLANPASVGWRPVGVKCVARHLVTKLCPSERCAVYRYQKWRY